MSIKVMLYGDKIDLADDLQEEFVAEAKSAIGDAGTMLVTEVERRLSLRQGSASSTAPEGEAPEQDTGALLRSIRRIPPTVKGRLARSGVQTTHPGAARLENGFTDKRGIRTFKHPFLAPSLEAMQEPIGAMLNARLG